jgi:hypothetical protein
LVKAVYRAVGVTVYGATIGAIPTAELVAAPRLKRAGVRVTGVADAGDAVSVKVLAALCGWRLLLCGRGGCRASAISGVACHIGANVCTIVHSVIVPIARRATIWAFVIVVGGAMVISIENGIPVLILLCL